MFIQTEFTPNPNVVQFFPGKEINHGDTIFVNRNDVLDYVPVARKLFDISDIEAVFVGRDFISVTKYPGAKWDILKPEILSIIMDFCINNDDFVIFSQKSEYLDDDNGEYNAIIKEIKELIESRVRPAVAADGGDIIFHSFADGVVKLELRGACSGCPSSSVTLKNGIENMLKYYIPEIVAVEAV